MTRIVAVCPGGLVTGGAELLHQFVDRLIEHGGEAAICYYPFFRAHSKSEQYAKYRTPVVNYADLDRRRDAVVLPEVYTYLASRFAPEHTYLWWMSVDNYLKSSTLRHALRNHFAPWRFARVGTRAFDRAFAGHFYQSEYARHFLAQHNVAALYHLGDYIHDDYIAMSREVDYARKRDLVVFNPAKGFEQTQKIVPLLTGIDVVPVAGMTRTQVTRLLCEAKVYIDFGAHPGKDRIPREAAMLGCCVITNRRGSAGNAVDIPIGDKYKFDDFAPSFERDVAEMIHSIVRDFPSYKVDFDAYREIIASEKALFDQRVASILEMLDRKANGASRARASA